MDPLDMFIQSLTEDVKSFLGDLWTYQWVGYGKGANTHDGNDRQAC